MVYVCPCLDRKVLNRELAQVRRSNTCLFHAGPHLSQSSLPVGIQFAPWASMNSSCIFHLCKKKIFFFLFCFCCFFVIVFFF